MNVNLISLKINTQGDNNQFVRFSLVNTSMVKKALETGKNYHKSPTYYIVSRDELPLIIECLNGTSKFYPFFDDGIHKLQFQPAGIVALEISPPHGDYNYFTFPGKFLVQYLLAILNNENTPIEYDLTKYIYKLKCQYAPRIGFEFTDYGDFYNLPYTVKESLKRNIDKPRFIHGLKTLVRIAKNHSSGDKTTIYLSFDSLPKGDNIPDSYYWQILTHDNKRVMNGGLIFHPKYIDGVNDYSQGDYSIHT